MVIENVSIFNQDYSFNGKPITKKWNKYANEIRKTKNTTITKASPAKLSPTTKDVLYIEDNDLNFLFVCAMLFVNADIKKIAEYVGVKETAISIFQEFFFDLSNYRGVLGKINFFKSLLYHENKFLQQLGITLKSSHIFGIDYINWKFALNLSSTAMDDAIKTTFKDMYFKYVEKSFKVDSDNLKEVENHIKLGKQLIGAALDMQRALTQTQGGSTVDEIKEYLTKFNDEVMSNEQWTIPLDIVDIDLDNALTDEQNEKK